MLVPCYRLTPQSADASAVGYIVLLDSYSLARLSKNIFGVHPFGNILEIYSHSHELISIADTY
jgi:hypothetical protein